jgi:DNA-binding NarL/FixJ family response regulator
MTIRVLLADDHVLFGQAVGKLLAQRYEVVDIVDDGKALLTSARTHRPDVIITDITMPHMSGMDAVRSLRRDPHIPKVVFLTMHSDPELARECFNCGGSAFVTKTAAFDELVSAIDAVSANRQYVSPEIAGGMIRISQEPSTPNGHLSLRQREILQLLAEGKTMKEIASLTNLSTRTVEWHKYRMMRLFNIQRSAELVQVAVDLRLIS